MFLETLVTFQAPHVARKPAASLDAAFAQKLDREAQAAKIATADDALKFSLGATASALHFGLGHRTRLTFDGEDREGNCVEYAELFGQIFNRERGAVDARAWVVRSDARVLGETVSNPAWKDHDWVLVVVRTEKETKRLYVDPTLYDTSRAWDISRAVRGDVTIP